jgi:hypothetical protein
MTVSDPNKSKSLLDTVLTWTVVLFLVKEVFGGVFRYVTTMTGTVALNYVPPLLAMLALALYYLDVLRTGKIHRAMLVLGCFVLFYGAYALFNTLPISQTLIGFYLWLPFFAGFLLHARSQEHVLTRWIFLLWGIAVFGMIANSFVQFPWTGESYEVLGTVREVSRGGSYLGYDRLAGFGRSSFVTSYLILFYSSVILCLKPYWIGWRVACYLISIVPIFISTNKTAILLWAVIPFALGGYQICKNLFSARFLLPYYWAKSTVILLFVVMIGMPLLSDMPSLFQDRQTFYFFSFRSMVERVNYEWPVSLALMEAGGNPVLGRGVGGIGTAQQFIEPDRYAAADNFFVYLYVSVGLVGVALCFFSLILNFKYDYLADRDEFAERYLLLVYILGIGIVVNTIEGPVQAILLGLLIARGLGAQQVRVTQKSHSRTLPQGVCPAHRSNDIAW